MGRLQELYAELTRRRVFRALLGWRPLASGTDVEQRPGTGGRSAEVEPGPEAPDPDGETERGPRDRPGPLSALLQELARAPGDELLSAWQHELREGDAVGRFRVLRELGRGGFGAVYEARDSELGRHVALKALRPRRTGQELSADWIKKEAEAVARLDHPCIVTLFDVGTAEGGPYLVMELLRGETLSRRLARGPLPVPDALHVARQVARGLAHAHARGVLHRDLKPANVFLCDDGRVKLLDFGLAHLLGKEGARGAGTPGYMAPEQARGEPIDARADVYAAAMTLRESLTGHRAPGGAAPMAAALRGTIEKALSASPETRPRDGTAWLEEIASAEEAIDRPRKVARVAALGFAAIALAAGVALLSWRHGRGGAPPAETGVPSVAVLAFADMSPGHDQEYLADGVAEEILNGLAHVRGLRVIGRTSSFSFKGRPDDLRTIGRRLGAGNILEGSVRKEGNRIRITAQLVRADDGSHLWSETFDREAGAVLEIQEQIAREVAQALRVRLLPGEDLAARWAHTGKPDAYHQLLLARDFARRGGVEGRRRSLGALERAVAIDPAYAAAWAYMSRVLTGILQYEKEDPELRERALRAADRAVELAPGLPQAWASRAEIRRKLSFDVAGARSDLDRARTLDPNGVLRLGNQGEGRSAETIAREDVPVARREAERDPLDPAAWVHLGLLLLEVGDLDRAGEGFARALEIAPGHGEAALHLCLTLVAGGRAAEALSLARESPEEWLRLWCASLAHFDLGDAAASDAALRQIESRFGDYSIYQLAEIQAWRGNVDAGFRELERALAAKDMGLGLVRHDPLLRKLHGDPRWPAFLARLDGGRADPVASGAAYVAAAPSIAVLPFADMSPGHDQEYFADGVAEEIRGALSVVPGLTVLGRISSERFKGRPEDLKVIGQRLGVAHVLEGSLRKDGGQIRLTARLVRVADGAQLWSHRYDGKLAGIFKAQDEIARAVVAALPGKLAGAERPARSAHDPEAYAAYLLGRHLHSRMTHEELGRTVSAFEKAVAIEPGFAAAWAGLSLALEERSGWQASAEGILGDKRRALEAADRAVRLEPEGAHGYVARANLVDVRGWNWTASIADARQAVELDPGDAVARGVLGDLLVQTGDDGGLRELRRATEIDPLSAVAWNKLGFAAGLVGDRELPAKALDRAREVNPRNDWRTIVPDRTKEEQDEEVLRETPGPLDAVLRYQKCEVLRRRGRIAEARQVLEEMTTCCPFAGAWQIALAHDNLGDRDEAFEWLERARVQMDEGIRVLKRARRFRGDPRTAVILRKMNLSAE